MKVYNEKKQLVGYISMQNGMISLQKDADSAGLSALTGARKKYFGIWFRDLFLWFGLADLFTIFGYWVNEKFGSGKSEHLWLKLVTSDNRFLAAPFSFLMQFFAVAVTCLVIRKMKWLLVMYCLRTVFVICLAIGILPFNLLTLSLELLMIVMTPFVLRHLFFSEYIRYDTSKIADRIPESYQFNVLIPGVAFLLSLGLMLFGLIPLAKIWKADSAEVFEYIGSIGKNEGGFTLGVSLCLLRAAEAYLCIAGAIVVIRIMKEEKRKREAL